MEFQQRSGGISKISGQAKQLSNCQGLDVWK